MLEDGSVAAWGDNGVGQRNVPGNLGPVSAIAAGDGHSLALKRDGTVAAWGDDLYGQSTVPEGLSGVVQIAAGRWHSLALRADGTVIAWGRNDSGQCTMPGNLDRAVAIAAGLRHSLALRADGTVVGWGNDSAAQVPPGLKRAVGIEAGESLSLAIQEDGSLVGWGWDPWIYPGAFSNPGMVLAVAAGEGQILMLVGGSRPRLAPLGFQASGAFELELHGEPGQPYTVQFSPDLLNLSYLTNFIAPAPATAVFDPGAADQPRRFYRASTP